MAREKVESYMRALYLELSSMYDPEDYEGVQGELNTEFEGLIDEAMKMGVSLA